MANVQPFLTYKSSKMISIYLITIRKLKSYGDFPGDAVVKNLPANAGDTGSSPVPGRSHVPRSN